MLSLGRVLIGILGSLLASEVLRAIITRLLIVLGVGVASYFGVGTLFANLWVKSGASFGQLPNDVVAFLTLCKFPKALNIIQAAITAALTLRGLSAAGAVSKLGIRRGGALLPTAPPA